MLAKAVSTNGDVDPRTQAGADLEYSLSSSTTLNLTLNTDCSETELDARSVNLTMGLAADGSPLPVSWRKPKA